MSNAGAPADAVDNEFLDSLEAETLIARSCYDDLRTESSGH